MKTCFIDGGVFIDKPELTDPLKKFGEVEIFTGIPKDIAEVVQRAGEAEIIAFGLMQFSREMIDNLPKLKVLQFVGTGMWNFVDVEYAESKGIKVLNIEAYGNNAVAEFAVAMSFTLAKKITMANDVLKNNDWHINGLLGKEITEMTVGVLGTGNIGAQVAKKFKALGSKVIANDIYENDSLKNDYNVEYVSVEEVFKRSDLITLHMKVTKENEKMIGKKYFDLVKDGTLFINVARAELVDNVALFEALKSGKIGGAAIDVYETEPPAESDYELARLENVIATPHIAFNTQDANDKAIIMTVESILNAIN